MTGTLGNFHLDAGAQEISFIGRESQPAQDFGERRLECQLISKSCLHGSIQFRRRLGFRNVFKVNVLRLKCAAEPSTQERRQRRTHRMFKQVNQ